MCIKEGSFLRIILYAYDWVLGEQIDEKEIESEGAKRL